MYVYNVCEHRKVRLSSCMSVFMLMVVSEEKGNDPHASYTEKKVMSTFQFYL